MALLADPTEDAIVIVRRERSALTTQGRISNVILALLHAGGVLSDNISPPPGSIPVEQHLEFQQPNDVDEFEESMEVLDFCDSSALAVANAVAECGIRYHYASVVGYRAQTRTFHVHISGMTDPMEQ